MVCGVYMMYGVPACVYIFVLCTTIACLNIMVQQEVNNNNEIENLRVTLLSEEHSVKHSTSDLHHVL